MRLTDDERRKIADGTIARVDGTFLRPIEQWQEILADQPSSIEAAARILGDITCFQADRGIKRRNGAVADVMQLARALEAWAMLFDWKLNKGN